MWGAVLAHAKLATGASPVHGLTLPVGYRQWQLVSVSYMAAYRDGTLPFPDGSILVKLAWNVWHRANSPSNVNRHPRPANVNARSVHPNVNANASAPASRNSTSNR